MALRLLKFAISIIIVSNLLWLILTSSPLIEDQLQAELSNKKVQLLIAHPDDEVMFFGPSLNELVKKKYNNTIFVTCFSSGNDAGLGKVRTIELQRSLQILGITQFEIIDDESKFKDSMGLRWNANDILEYVKEDTDILLTFDNSGVSSHPNHISLHEAAVQSKKPLLTLRTWNVFEKYSFNLLTNHGLIKKLVNSKANFLTTAFKSNSALTDSQHIFVFADISSFVLTLSAMLNGHQSQMVWFRWGWVFISHYLNSNELIFTR